MSARLDDMMDQIRNQSRWPPAPPREWRPATLDDLARVTLTGAELLRALKPRDLLALASGAEPDKRG